MGDIMFLNNELIIAKNSEKELCLLPNKLNRHGIITGATGTGKTITVKVICEALSAAGIPSFVADIKGDLSGTCEVGEDSENIQKRVNKLSLDGFKLKSFPVRFWDVYGERGHHVKAKISSFSSSLLSRILELSDAQEGNLSIVFKIAEDENMPIVDLKDLKSALKYVSDNRNNYISEYGNITTQSIATIQRKLLEFESNGACSFFGEPALDLRSLMAYDVVDGRGMINILDAVELSKDYNLYSTLMLWLLNELYDKMPEVGDLDKPKLVLFIDEAHMLFNEMKPAMLRKIVQIVKLIRSKGVGLFFISQSPSDIPEDVLSQLGNRIQHNLKAYTPNEMKSVKIAAKSFRENPNFDSESAILELSTGEALVSFVNEEGQPSVVERAYILPPESKMGVADEKIREDVINQSPMKNVYDMVIDTTSASEIIEEKNKTELFLQEQARLKEEKEKALLEKEKEAAKEKKTAAKKKPGAVEKFVDKTVSHTASTIGRKIGDSIFKSLFK